MTGIRYPEALDEALCFGWIDGKLMRVDEKRVVQRYSPRKKSSPWSLLNKKRAERLIAAGKMTEAGLEKIK